MGENCRAIAPLDQIKAERIQTESMHQSDPPRPPKETLPTIYNLPSEDPNEPGLSDEFYIYQPRLLQETFHLPNYPANEVFVGTDLNLYTMSTILSGTSARTGLPF
jgi:Uma2 family endonuclease